MERTNLLQKVSFGEKTVYLLGTAHISEQSVEDVEQAIDMLSPDSVAVELDAEREKRLIQKENEQWKNLNMFKVIRQKKAMFLLSSIVLSSFQRRLGENLSVAPGQEMLTALQKSKEKGIPTVLVDRSAEITLKRAWRLSSFFGKQKILATLISVVFSRETVSEEELAELKTKSTQGQMVEEIARFLPNLKKVLVDERDQYLSTKIMSTPGKVVLAVLGAAHVPGIKERIEKVQQEHEAKQVQLETMTSALNQELKSLEEIPRQKKLNPLSFILPLGVLGLFVWGFYRGGAESISENFLWWWGINGGLSLLGAILALAHPVTMLVSFLAAPITSLNPFVGVGLVTGLSETFFRTPRVRDFEKLQDLSLSLRGLFSNRITRILLVFMLTSLGSIIGSFVGISVIATHI